MTNNIQIEAYINNFVTRSFRNNADGDYIAARTCYKSCLFPQFLWFSLQAFEKYYKAILLYNRIKAKDISHSLIKAQRYAESLPFIVELSDSSKELITYLDKYGSYRYLEVSYFVKGPKLLELDRAVWEIRRYCKVINYKFEAFGQEPVEMLEHELEAIKLAKSKPYQSYRIIDGLLEKIIDNKKHPSRSALIWQNAFYGKSYRKSITIPTPTYAENAPFSLNPELIEHLKDYIKIPKDLMAAFRSLQVKKDS